MRLTVGDAAAVTAGRDREDGNDDNDDEDEKQKTDFQFNRSLYIPKGAFPVDNDDDNYDDLKEYDDDDR